MYWIYDDNTEIFQGISTEKLEYWLKKNYPCKLYGVFFFYFPKPGLTEQWWQSPHGLTELRGFFQAGIYNTVAQSAVLSEKSILFSEMKEKFGVNRKSFEGADQNHLVTSHASRLTPDA